MIDQLKEELQRLAEQSKEALEQTWSNVEQKRQEEIQISKQVAEMEEKLRKLNMNKSQHSVNNADGNEAHDEQEMTTSDHADDLSASSARKRTMDDADEDTRIQQMRKEREEKVKDIKAQTTHKDILLQSLHRYAAQQQDTIQDLQRKLEDLHERDNGLGFQRDVQEKEQYVQELREELHNLQNSLTEIEMEHYQLEQEWDDQEDLVADTEADASRELSQMQDKLDHFTQEMQTKEENRSEMLQNISQMFEGMRQDLMEFLDPDSSHSLMLEIRSSFESLQEKEDELARILVDRLEEQSSLLRVSKSLEKIDRTVVKALDKVDSLSEVLVNKLDLKSAEDIPDENHSELNSLQEEIKLGLEQSIKNVKKQSDNLEGNNRNPIEQNRESIDVLIDSMEKLNSTIRSRFWSSLREFNGRETQNDTEDNTYIFDIRNEIEEKNNELSELMNKLIQSEEKIKVNVSKATESFEILEKELRFLADGLKQKNSMISTIKDVKFERTNSEASLMDELNFLYDKGLIHESDFGDSKKSLLNKLREYT